MKVQDVLVNSKHRPKTERPNWCPWDIGFVHKSKANNWVTGVKGSVSTATVCPSGSCNNCKPLDSKEFIVINRETLMPYEK